MYARIVDAQPTVGDNGLRTLELRIEAALPEEFRSFALCQDGGRPEPDSIRIGNEITDVHSFIELRGNDSACDIYGYLDEFENLLGRRLIPFARDSGSILFCLSLNTGKIVFVDYADPALTAFHLTGSFNEFLNNLGSE